MPHHRRERIELWWHDEARIGQTNKLTRRWALRGTRLRAPHDQRTAWAYLFGAICPAEGMCVFSAPKRGLRHTSQQDDPSL